MVRRRVSSRRAISGYRQPDIGLPPQLVIGLGNVPYALTSLPYPTDSFPRPSYFVSTIACLACLRLPIRVPLSFINFRFLFSFLGHSQFLAVSSLPTYRVCVLC